MKVLYKNKKIKNLCTNEKNAIKTFGTEVAIKLFNTINLLENTKNLKDILVLPQYKLHLLKGNMQGIFSMYLWRKTGFRLLLIPLDENEKIVKAKEMSLYITTVCVEILEVSKHYE